MSEDSDRRLNPSELEIGKAALYGQILDILSTGCTITKACKLVAEEHNLRLDPLLTLYYRARKQSMLAPNVQLITIGKEKSLLAYIENRAENSKPLQAREIAALAFYDSPECDERTKQQWYLQFKRKYRAALRGNPTWNNTDSPGPSKDISMLVNEFHEKAVSEFARLGEGHEGTIAFGCKVVDTKALSRDIHLTLAFQDGQPESICVDGDVSVVPFVTSGGKVLSVYIIMAGDPEHFSFDPNDTALYYKEKYCVLGVDRIGLPSGHGYDFKLYINRTGKLDQQIFDSMLKSTLPIFRTTYGADLQGVLICDYEKDEDFSRFEEDFEAHNIRVLQRPPGVVSLQPLDSIPFSGEDVRATNEECRLTVGNVLVGGDLLVHVKNMCAKYLSPTAIKEGFRNTGLCHGYEDLILTNFELYMDGTAIRTEATKPSVVYDWDKVADILFRPT